MVGGRVYGPAETCLGAGMGVQRARQDAEEGVLVTPVCWAALNNRGPETS